MNVCKTLTIIALLAVVSAAGANEGTLSLRTDYTICYENHDTDPEGGNWILVTLDVTLPPPGADISALACDLVFDNTIVQYVQAGDQFHNSFSWFPGPPSESGINTAGAMHVEVKQPLGESLPRQETAYDVVTFRFRVVDDYSGCVDDLVAFTGDAHRIYLDTDTPPIFVTPDTVGMDEVAIAYVETFTCPDPNDVYLDCESEIDDYVAANMPTTMGGCVFLEVEMINSQYVLLDGQTEIGTGCFGSPLGVQRTYRWYDVCQNSCTFDWLFIIELNERPTASIVTPVNLPCNDLPDPDPNEVEAYSYCGDPIPVEHPDCPDGTCIWWISDTPAGGNLTYCERIDRVYRVVDPCSNPARVRNVTQRFRIEDDEDPVITTCPPNMNLQCPEDLPMPEDSLAGFGVAGGVAEDNCGVESASYVDDNTNYDPCGGTIVRTWTITDTCHHTTTCDQVFTINDTIAPWFTTAPGDLTLECGVYDQQQIDDWADSAVAADNCDAALNLNYSTSDYTDLCCDTYTEIYTWTATDACGNDVTHSATLTVRDTQPPEITCPGPVTVACPEDVPAGSAGCVTVSDDCCDSSEITVTWSDASDGETCPETITRTYRATDDCGNWAECTQIITVNDEEDPTITCPGGFNAGAGNLFIGQRLDGTLPDDPVEGDPTWYYYPEGEWWNVWFPNEYDPFRKKIIHLEFDWTAEFPETFEVALNYSTTDWINDVDFPLAGDDIFIERVSLGELTSGHVTWQYTIPFCPAWVSVDIRGPGGFWIEGMIWHVCVEEIECDEIPDPLDLSGLTVDDNCTDPNDLVLTVDESFQGDFCGVGGILMRTYTVADECGNTASCFQKFSVVDQTPPDITCPDDVEVECDESTDPNDTGWAEATDTCDADVDITYSDSFVAGCAPYAGTLTRTWTATDDCGNYATCDQVITVVDTTDPVIADMPDDIVVGAQNHACTYAIVSWTPPTFGDNCDTVLPMQAMDNGTPVAPGDLFTVGTHTITYTATDDCGNSTSDSFTITVTDNVQIHATVTLGGTGSVTDLPYDRCILFEVTDCAQPEVYVYQLMTFEEGGVAEAVIPVPCGQFECIRAQDPLHSLWAMSEDLVSEIIDEGGGEYTVQYNVELTLWLGNLTGFYYEPDVPDCIDIEDYVLFSYQYTGTVSCDTDCDQAVNGPAHGDFTGDCVVGPEDYGFLALSFGVCDDGLCCDSASPVPTRVRDRISVAELKDRGLGYLRVVDVDGNGWITLEDCTAYMQQAGQRPSTSQHRNPAP